VNVVLTSQTLLRETERYRPKSCACLYFSSGLVKQSGNVVASSWGASVRPTFHSRHPQCLLQNGIFVSVWPSPRVPEPRVPAPVLLLVTLPDLPVLWVSDLAQVPSPDSNAAPNKLER
jgi:hypothetical protein